MLRGLAILLMSHLALAAGTPACAQDQVQLKLSHWLPAPHPLHQAFSEWSASVTRAAHGTITVEVYPDRQLGKAFDHYDMARTGVVDLALADPGLQIGRFPIFEAINLPLLVRSGIGGSAALDAWYRGHVAREMKGVRYCLALTHEPATIHSVRRKTVLEPDDVKGMKIVSPQHTIAAFLRSLGGRNVRVANDKLVDAMVRAVADAVTMPWHSAIAFDVHTIAKRHLDLPLYVTGLALVMHPATYARLSPTQQAAIDAHCGTVWAGRLASRWTLWERDGMAQMRSMKGHDAYAPAPAQVAQWRKAAEPATAKWAAGVRDAGADADAILKALRTELTRRGAAF